MPIDQDAVAGKHMREWFSPMVNKSSRGFDAVACIDLRRALSKQNRAPHKQLLRPKARNEPYDSADPGTEQCSTTDVGVACLVAVESGDDPHVGGPRPRWSVPARETGAACQLSSLESARFDKHLSLTQQP